MNRYERTLQTIATDPVLHSLGFQRVYRSTATDDPTEESFIVLNWGGSRPELPEVPDAPQTLVAWLYSRLSLDLVDDGLPRLREILTALEGADGVAQVQWVGDSGDLYDDRWRAETRNATFIVH